MIQHEAPSSNVNATTLSLLGLPLLAVGALYGGYKYMTSSDVLEVEASEEEVLSEVEEVEDVPAQEQVFTEVEEDGSAVEVKQTEIVVPELTDEQKKNSHIKTQVSYLMKQNEMLLQYMQSPGEGGISGEYVSKLISNYVTMVELMKQADYSEDRISGMKRKAALHYMTLARAQFKNREYFSQAIAEIEKIIEGIPYSGPIWLDVTKLKVKHLSTVANEFAKAIATIDDHIQQLLDEDGIDINQKKVFLKLLLLKAKTQFEEECYGDAQEVLMSALKVCGTYQLDPVQPYAELASCIFANGLENEKLFDDINSTMGNLVNGSKGLYRSPYLKTMECGIKYSENSCTLKITLKAKRPNVKHYYGVCYFGHHQEDLQPVIKTLQPDEQNLISFEQEAPILPPGTFFELHINIFSDKTCSVSLGSHYQLFFVKGRALTGSEVKDYFRI